MDVSFNTVDESSLSRNIYRLKAHKINEKRADADADADGDGDVDADANVESNHKVNANANANANANIQRHQQRHPEEKYRTNLYSCTLFHYVSVYRERLCSAC